MRTLTTDTSTKWISSLIEIEIALEMTRQDIPICDTERWDRVYRAQIRARALRDQLLAHTAADFEIEVAV